MKKLELLVSEQDLERLEKLRLKSKSKTYLTTIWKAVRVYELLYEMTEERRQKNGKPLA